MFWKYNKEFDNRAMIIEADKSKVISYFQFWQNCSALTKKLKNPLKKLILIFCDQNYETILTYVASLNSDNAVILVESLLNDKLKSGLIEYYKPDIIFNYNKKSSEDYNKSIINSINCLIRNKRSMGNISNKLAVLLSTSGTTGSPKFVRLSYKNIQSNADAIVKYLHLNVDERPISSLPFSYSYGLSVLNSHMSVGASIVLTKKSFVLRDFWEIFNKYKCTSFAGVPYTYQLLKKTNFHKVELSTLKYLTQAGGTIDKSTLEYFIEYSEKNNILFYSMYGQTEASPRISYVPPEKIKVKMGSIGTPIPGGTIRLYIGDKLINENFMNGEITYYGKNVMLGYAQSRDDLDKGDEMKGELRTGDIGYRDSDGYYFLTGRKNRFIKIFGLRLNLDDIEKLLEKRFRKIIACIGEENRLLIFIEHKNNEIDAEEVKKYLVRMYRLHISTISVVFLDRIHFSSNGKKDYNKLKI